MSTQQAKLGKRANELRAQWHNGNREAVDTWIGNSATRLLAMISSFSANEGTTGCRMFLDDLRNRRGF